MERKLKAEGGKRRTQEKQSGCGKKRTIKEDEDVYTVVPTLLPVDA